MYGLLKIDMTKITFFTHLDQLKETLPPVPSSKFWPEWFRKQSSGNFNTETREGINTVKSCPAVHDVLNMGYVIPLWSDFKLVRTNDNMGWRSPNPDQFPIVVHPENQINNYPFSSDSFKGTVKFINPWYIKTPPGYSTWFISPMYHSNEHIEVLTGSIDTDRYHEAHVNTFFRAPLGTEIMLDYGMPLVQVIPYKREEFEMEVLTGDHRTAINKAMQFIHGSMFKAQSYRKKLSPKWFK